VHSSASLSASAAAREAVLTPAEHTQAASAAAAAARRQRHEATTNAGAEVADLRDFDGMSVADSVAFAEPAPAPAPVRSSAFRKGVRASGAAPAATPATPGAPHGVLPIERNGDAPAQLLLHSDASPPASVAAGAGIGAAAASGLALEWAAGVAAVLAHALGRRRVALTPMQATSALPSFSSESLGAATAAAAAGEAALLAAIAAGAAAASLPGGQVALARTPRTDEVRRWRRDFEVMLRDPVLGVGIQKDAERAFAQFVATRLE
jgi:hypothetical protein